MMSSVDVTAPILPAQGAAGLILGVDRRRVLATCGPPLGVELLNEKRIEILDYGVVFLYVEHDRVESIELVIGYRGTTTEGLRPGTKWETLITLYPDVRWNEEEFVWYIPGLTGLSMEIVTPVKAPDEIRARVRHATDGVVDFPISHEFLVDEAETVLDPDYSYVGSIVIDQRDFG